MKKNDSSTLKIILLTIIFVIFTIILVMIGKIINMAMSNNTVTVIFLSVCILVVIVTIIWTEIINYRDIRLIDKKMAKEYKKENDFNYYRDKVSNYSPAILSYCYNKKLNYQKILTITLIDLSQKEYIKFEENSIILLKDDFSTLEENQKFVLESIKYNRLSKMYKRFKKEYLYYVKEDCFDKQIYTNIKNFDRLSKTIETVYAVFTLTTIIISFLNLLGMKENPNYNVLVGILTYLCTYMVAILSFTIIDRFFLKTHYRTEKGIDIATKLQGLRKFIVEFTDLKNKNIKDIKLYDEYILYTLLLDINGNLSKEINQMIKKIIDKDDNTWKI